MTARFPTAEELAAWRRIAEDADAFEGALFSPGKLLRVLNYIAALEAVAEAARVYAETGPLWPYPPLVDALSALDAGREGVGDDEA